MVITCGDTYDTVLTGAFIESLYPGSPADLDGRISVGDQIMSVNGVNVQNDYFLTVVDLIQCSNSPVELVVAKNASCSTKRNNYLQKEIIEKPFTKSKAWIVGDEDSDSSKSVKDNTYIMEMPIPKPRKKLTQKKSIEEPQLDGPDLTLNHSKQCIDESDRNVMEENFGSTNCSIPDIIASQMRHVSLPPLHSLNYVSENGETTENSAVTSIDNDLLPGEVFHVVLDKKGGSLGLNIFQGTETSTSLKKYIYIHSVIPNGAAELDGRIKPGDKLLEVNGIVLEDMSYQEVVTTLRESPQVAHLVLEKGNGYSSKPEMDNLHNSSTLSRRTDILGPKDNDNFQISSQNGSVIYKPENTHTLKHKANTSLDPSEEMYLFLNSSHDKNSFPSLPISVESSLHCAKEISSAPSSYQPSDYHKDKSFVHSTEDEVNGNGSVKSDDSFNSSPYAKDENKFQRLSSYKSTPNLADSSDDDEINRKEGNLYRNRSTDCLLYSHFMNPHQALIDLYRNYSYVRENTYTVTIRKSSRGLGLSISGGKDASRKDLFSQLIQIRKLYPLQPALECGKLALGDIILEVNGTSMVGLTHTEALEVLRSAPLDVVLKVFRPSKSLIPSFSIFKGGIWPGLSSSSSSASSSLSRTEKSSYQVKSGEFEVTLIKQDGSLGFTIAKSENFSENPNGIYVRELVREHAKSDGRIQPGDRILQVNGTDVSNMSHPEAIACLRNTPDEVTLKLFREDPPLSPTYLEEYSKSTKHLRWEAIQLLNERGKQKDQNDDSTLKKRIKRKLRKTPDAASSASSESSSSSSGQEHIINENEVMHTVTDDIPLDGIGLQRNQRPKSLDVLNSSDRKRFIGHSEEDSFHRQSSVMCPNVDSKSKSENADNNTASGKTGGKNLLKWRGSTLPDSEESGSIDTIQENTVTSSRVLSTEREESSENKSDDEDFKPIPFPRTTSCCKERVNTFDVNLDRGWHLRLGFSVCDPIPVPADSPRCALPNAVEVKAVYPGSLAEKDGRIKVGDRIVEVNGESLLGKSAREIIDILRKTRGVIRMVFCRLETQS